MTDSWQTILLYGPSVVFAVLLLISVIGEPRRFRNAIWLALFVLSLSSALLLDFWRDWVIVPLALILILTPLAVVVFLLANAAVVIRREGFSMSTALPALLALALVGFMVVYPLSVRLGAPGWLQWLALLAVLEGLWFFFTFAALMLYSWVYRIMPKRRTYDYIIIHGAGLQGSEPTPLLRGRIDKAVALWHRQHDHGVFIVSGGQGADEEVSEAEAMKRYLIGKRGVPAERILMEDTSRTTMENLVNSKEIMDERSSLARSLGVRDSGVGSNDGVSTSVKLQRADNDKASWTSASISRASSRPKPSRRRKASRAKSLYRAALVTSDYHVFRASEYAHEIGLNADGIGCHTKGYYWPTAFIREFVAITRAHLWPYAVIAALWLVWVAIMAFLR